MGGLGELITCSKSLFKRSVRFRVRTSGTTGTPLTTFQDRRVIAAENAFLWRQLQWAGFSKGQRCVWLRGDMIIPYEQITPPFWRTNRAENMLMISSYHLSEKNAPHYVIAIETFNPTLIQAYPSSVAYLATF